MNGTLAIPSFGVAHATRALRLIAPAAALAVAACGMAPIRSETPQTAALSPNPESPLVALVKNSTPPGDGSLSGFRLMPAGFYSLDARVELARRATKSLDLQYYQINND